MLRKKLKFQILFSVLLSLVLGFTSLYYYSSNEIKKTIDQQQLTFYTEKIDTILYTLENRYQKLLKTQLITNYEFTFKQAALKDIEQVHHKEVLLIHPFILNEKRDFVLHPSFNNDTFNKTDTNQLYEKIINNKEGNFYIKQQGKQRWVVFKYFTQWDWIVGYSMPLNVKYATLKDFQNKFLMITVLIVLFISMLIILIVRYFLSPIEQLIVAAQRITKGDLSSEIKINGSYELTQLSNSFSIMKDKIKEHIDELENRIRRRTLKLSESNEALELTIKNLKLAQTQLIESEKMASLGELVAGVAHEINTPVGVSLTGVTHMVEINDKILKMYENDSMTEDTFKNFLEESTLLAHQINKNLERTAHLISSFKQVAVDQTSEKKRKFEIKHYLTDVIFSLNNIIKKTNLEIKVTSDEPIFITSYPGAYSQIITNLIINSINHAYDNKEKGLITISISKNEKNIILLYRDDGKGIQKEHLNHIFDPFFTTKRDKGGTGLGLNIIYNIITSQLEGSISCSSQIEKGAEFLITLPFEK